MAVHPSRRELLAFAALGAAGCRAPRRSAAEPDVDVIVLGAGLAGLAAAQRLLAERRTVVVLEARERVGGRVHTLRDPFEHGQFAEAGATYVPPDHDVTRRYLSACGLGLVPSFADGSAFGLYARGELFGRGGFREPPFELREDERGQGRRGLFRRYVLDALRELGDGALDAGSAGARRLDGVSFAEFLREHGASPGAVELLGLGYLGIVGDGIETVSALSVVRELVLATGTGGSERIAGGSARLPMAMAEPLEPILRTGAIVRALEEIPGGVRVRFREQGSERTLVGQRVIVTLPTPVLRSIELAVPLSDAKRRALATVASTSVTRTFLQCSRRTWGELAAVDTDLPVMGLKDATAAQPGAAGILESYASGAQARAFDALGEDARVATVLAEVEQVFAGTSAVFQRGASWSWDEDPFARGGYAWFRPGEVCAHLDALQRPEGRVHFAGEHTSVWTGWMQGALESGERAAAEVVGVAVTGVGGLSAPRRE